MHVSTYIVNRTYEAYLQEGIKAQTLNAAGERRLEDSAFLLAMYVFPAFRTPLEDFDGRGVEFECGFYVVLQGVLEKCPHHPAPSHSQLVRATAWFCILPYCDRKSGSNGLPAFSF